MQKIDKYYHENRRREEEQQHWGKIASGEEIRIGENYHGITSRDGHMFEEDVKALAYCFQCDQNIDISIGIKWSFTASGGETLFYPDENRIL